MTDDARSRCSIPVLGPDDAWQEATRGSRS
jgi:hypothetical protein